MDRMIAGIAMIVIGVAGYFITLLRYYKAIESADWPTTEGTLISAGTFFSTGEGDTGYRLSLEYKYSVGGRKHVNSRYSYYGNPRSKRERDIKKIQHRLEAAPRLRVFYNPDDHSQACLSIVRELGLIIQYGIAAVVIVSLGIWLVLSS